MHGHPSWKDIMDASVSVERARDWSTALEDREAARSGECLPEARRAVASRIKVPAGTLENLRKRRLKAIAVHLYERLRGGVIRELQAEMMRLQHELQILQATGSDPRQNEVAEVAADLAKVRQALGLTP